MQQWLTISYDVQFYLSTDKQVFSSFCEIESKKLFLRAVCHAFLYQFILIRILSTQQNAQPLIKLAYFKN